MSTLRARLFHVRRLTVGAMVALGAVGCTIQDTKAPALQGPSEFALAFTLSAVPDVLSQDGASQAQIIVQARDANGQPARSVTFRADTIVNGTLADFGSLSARTLVTGADGRATLTYTAPPGTYPGIDTGQEVTIQVTPFGTDFSNALARTVRIRLIPPGILLPGGPQPAFTVNPAAPTAFSDVTFDASTSTPAPSTQIASYAWNFGDGSTGSGVVVFHRFAAGGYVVTLMVTDTNGVSNSTQKSLSIGASGTPPTADFAFSPTAPTVNQDILFNASTSKPGIGRSIVRYDWNMGSGAPRSGVNVTKSYDVAGSYTVVLTVTDDVGQTASSSKTVAVSAAVVTASFSFSPTAPQSGEQVNFNASGSISPSLPITNYAWDWGDGSTSPTNVAPTQSHQFFPPVGATRVYVVRLTITDSLNRQATTTQNVTVIP